MFKPQLQVQVVPFILHERSPIGPRHGQNNQTPNKLLPHQGKYNDNDVPKPHRAVNLTLQIHVMCKSLG